MDKLDWTALVFTCALLTMGVIAAVNRPTEDTEQIQKNAAKVQFLRQLCREDCFPGTLKSYDPRSELCECFPAVQ